MRGILPILVLAATSGAVQAADLCKAIALRDVAALENPRSIIPKGDYDTHITQYRVDKNTGEASFCSHGGYCFPTHVHVNGKKVEALRLTNCTVNRARSETFGDETIYDVDVIRSKVPAAELRRADLDDRFSEMGLSSACAGNVTDLYLSKPASRCARLARRALGGDAEAAKELQESFDCCSARR